MLLNDKKNAAIEAMKTTQDKCNKTAKAIQTGAGRRFKLCEEIGGQLYPEIEKLERSIVLSVPARDKTQAKKLKQLKDTLSGLRSSVTNFNSVVQQFKAEATNTLDTGTKLGVGGAATGVTISAMAPTAAMWVATTFGTASTGTAISSLSGVVATNAALAWLGGGTLAAGGGGIALGETLLALAGPIGWGIAGVAAVGGVFYCRNKNKNIIEKANKEVEKMNVFCGELSLIKKRLNHEVKLNKTRKDSIHANLIAINTMIESQDLDSLGIEFFNELEILDTSINQLVTFMNSRIELPNYTP